MCGIAGEVDFKGTIKPTENRAILLSKPLRYRGPDSHGYFIFFAENEISLLLCHTRLSIIDLSEASNQPMKSLSNNSIICFNGEIYNYLELRRELKSVGIEFKTESDTEVLLNGFEYWGIENLLQKVDGMFAFAIYSFNLKKLYIARDRLGKKPLYYYLLNNRLIFSSDIRSFEQLGLNLTIDLFSLEYYFQELSTPELNSIYKEINKVPCASYLCLDANQLTLKKFTSDSYSPKINSNRKVIVDNVETLLSNAISKRLIADVNVGAFLSAGIDSSLIVAIAASQLSSKLNTYTVGYLDYDKNEISGARLTALRYKTNHHEHIVNLNDLSLLDGLTEEFGEPFADSSMIPSYLICKAASNSEKVMLSGDGGDEIFGGYYDYYQQYRLQQYDKIKFASLLWRCLPKNIKNKRIQLLKELDYLSKLEKPQRLHRNMGFTASEVSRLQLKSENSTSADSEFKRIWNLYGIYENDLDNIMATSMHTRLINDYLVKIDRSSMYASLEVRSPFLDKQLFDYVSKLKSNELLKKGETKSLLKELGKKYLPHELINRPKTGFGIPMNHWLRKELKKEFIDCVLVKRQNIIALNYDFIQELFSLHCKGADYSHKLWAIYVFHKWAQKRS